jgi:pimeloyl-ACP methyl ester carboxylesterase
VTAVDLPSSDDSASIAEYVDVVVASIGDRRDIVLVAQSMGGFTAPLVAERVAVEMIVLVAGMVPNVGESPGDWWANTGQPDAQRLRAEEEGYSAGMNDPVALFLHDVPAEVVTESAHHVHEQSATPFMAPWPGKGWPDVPTRFLLCRDDRLFPAAFQRRVVAERLGIVPDEIEGGHLPALARPRELAARLHDYWVTRG